MGAIARDPEVTATQLTTWLSEVAGLADVRVDGLEIPSATGWSNETILFDGTWSEGAGTPITHRLVARIAPQAYTVFLEANFESQFRVMRALAEQSDVPMPKMLWFEPDPTWFGSPFWIMARVDGLVPGDSPPYATVGWLHDASPEQQARMWWNGIDAMAAVHRVDWRALDLGFLDDPARGSGASSNSCSTPASRSSGPRRVRPIRERARRSTGCGPTRPNHRPRRPPSCGVTRWLGNQMFRDEQVVAVLDWEMVALGDPRIDLGWWLFCDDALSTGDGGSRLPGFPSAAATVARWEELTGRRGDDLHWFLVFAGLRFTVVMMRLSKLLCEIGFAPEPFGYDNPISRAMDRLLAESPLTE